MINEMEKQLKKLSLNQITIMLSISLGILLATIIYSAIMGYLIVPMLLIMLIFLLPSVFKIVEIVKNEKKQMIKFAYIVIFSFIISMIVFGIIHNNFNLASGSV